MRQSLYFLYYLKELYMEYMPKFLQLSESSTNSPQIRLTTFPNNERTKFRPISICFSLQPSTFLSRDSEQENILKYSLKNKLKI